jgi:hypothetical protein
VRQVFFPPFEEAGDKSILDVGGRAEHGTASARASIDLQTNAWSRVLFSGDGSSGEQPERRGASRSRLLLEPSETSYGGQTEPRSSNKGNAMIHHSRRWGYGPIPATGPETHASLAPSILRESGLLLNSASSFTLNPRMEDMDVTMESMEMRPRTLRRSVTAQDGVENVKVSSVCARDSGGGHADRAIYL